jgi:hypothetical protein
MANRVNLDAMIPREDFAFSEGEFALDLFPGFGMAQLGTESPILKLLRKPDFQRETNHWSPNQIATFVASFLDNEVIPSLILWKSPTLIFVIDGGHRLSALRAWMEDDYGDGALSLSFYGGEITDDQKRLARRARRLIESKVGRFSTLKSSVDAKGVHEVIARRANRLFTRALQVQWVQGSAAVAETSFFKINSQGTPLDDTEEMLIENRRKPIAISARAVLRSGTGHKYWSAFSTECQAQIEKSAREVFGLLFEPEANIPIKTLDLPLGGTVSPVDALSLLVEFMAIAGNREGGKTIAEYLDDDDGSATLRVLKNTVEIVRRITGNSPASLGLHPVVYFYNENGKYSRFLFLGMAALITDRVKNNDGSFFKTFTTARKGLEEFLIDNKSLLGIILQNLSKSQRIPKIRDLFGYLVAQLAKGDSVTPEMAITQLGLRGRFFDVNAIQTTPLFTDETKSTIFIANAMIGVLKCPICGGLLDPQKSVSYDHKVPLREGGTGDKFNGQLVHPYCNTAVKN